MSDAKALIARPYFARSWIKGKALETRQRKCNAPSYDEAWRRDKVSTLAAQRAVWH